MREANKHLIDAIDMETTKIYTLPEGYVINIALRSKSIFNHKPNKLIDNIKLECSKDDISLNRITFEETDGCVHDETDVFDVNKISFQEICEYLVKYYIKK